MDIALEALRDYLRQQGRNLDEMVRCTRINRVERIMRPYLEALI
jgi:hypothetical protein